VNIDPWFVSGLVEGEGAFTYISGGTPVFSIRQRHDYADLVQMIADFFGVGVVYPCRARGRSQANSYYRVHRAIDLNRIIQHFDRYPLVSARKQAAYAAWKKLVFFKQQGRQAVRRHRDQQEALLKALSALNCRGRS